MLPLVLALLAVTGPPVRPEGQTVFPARTITSPARAFSLYFEPHVTNGLRGADYRMTAKQSDGSTRIAWKERREFTLRDPIVTDRGRTYGWAVVHGPGQDQYAPGGTVRLVAIDSEGRTAVEERIEEVPHGIGCMGPVGGPRILRLLPCESAGALVVFLNMTERNDFEEEAWVFDLTMGKKMSAFTPFPTVQEVHCTAELTRLFDIVCVRDTPLVLVHATRTKFNCAEGGAFGFGERWALFDLHGNRVWGLDDDDPRAIDYRAANDIRSSLKRESVSDKPGTFSFTMQRTKARVTLRTRRADDGTWIVDDALPARDR